MPSHTKPSRTAKRHEPEFARGPIVQRPNAFRNMPPYFYFRGKDDPDDIFVPRRKMNPSVLLTGIRTNTISDVLRDGGFDIYYKKKDDFVYLWGTPPDKNYKAILPYQRVNRFPGRGHLGRKDWLSEAMEDARKRFPDVYDFYPETFFFPEQSDAIRKCFETEEAPVFIQKPVAMSRGRDITLVTKMPEETKGRRFIVQRYIENPLLLHGLKFDVRVYVLVTSFRPLRAYLFRDGLVRLATSPYLPVTATPSDSWAFTHLTNWSINKASGSFHIPQSLGDEDASKWTLSHLFAYIASLQGSSDPEAAQFQGLDEEKMRAGIRRVAALTLLAVADKMEPMNSVLVTQGVDELKNCQVVDNDGQEVQWQSQTGKKRSFQHRIDLPCAEIYGFDILFDDHGKAWLIEANVSPETRANTPLDKAVKSEMFRTSLNILGLGMHCGTDFDALIKDGEEDRTDASLLKTSAAEVYRSLGTPWERLLPSSRPAALRLRPGVREDALLQRWLAAPFFTGPLASVLPRARRALEGAAGGDWEIGAGAN